MAAFVRQGLTDVQLKLLVFLAAREAISQVATVRNKEHLRRGVRNRVGRGGG